MANSAFGLSPFQKNVVRFSTFSVIFLGIVGVIIFSGDLLIAPPYAVTAYLVVFNRRSSYAMPSGIAASYLLVLASSAAFQFVLGVTVTALVLNVLVVSLFITFTPLSHPPALALTIFSFIVHDPLAFTATSLVVLAIVLAAAYLVDRIAPLRRALMPTAHPPPS